MQTIVRLVLILGFIFVTGCSRTPNKKSSITIKPNSVGSMAALPGGQTACFGVNVTGPGIAGSPANSCNLATGVVAGYVPQGQSIEAIVPSGLNRKVELLLYLKDAGDVTPCPKLGQSFSVTDLSHVYVVGSVDNLELKNQVESITITMNFPGVGQTIGYSMPPACSGVATNPGYKVLTGSTLATGTGYKMLGHAGHTLNNVVLTGTGYKLHIK